MSRLRLLAMLVLGFGLGSGVTYFAVAPKSANQPAEATKDAVPYRALDANLYMQISAEYRAACYQTYHFAFARLQEILVTRKIDKQMAIILDLDETVFDNGAYQSRTVQQGTGFDVKLWDAYEEKDHELVRLVPGAKDFLVAADRLGIALIYISNRDDKHRESTLKVIRRLGLPLPGEDRLKLMTDTSSKDIRRKWAFDNFDVVMLVGDNLRDFDDKPFKSAVDNTKAESKTDDPAKIDAAIEARFKAVDDSRAMFGRTWIILPNPAYGEWTKVLGNGTKDSERLRK